MILKNVGDFARQSKYTMEANDGLLISILNYCLNFSFLLKQRVENLYLSNIIPRAIYSKDSIVSHLKILNEIISNNKTFLPLRISKS